MEQTRTLSPCLQSLRKQRVSLVDSLEGHIEVLLDFLLMECVFTRDDQEEILYEKGPRGKVRKVLDILDSKGEEAAKIFLSATSSLSMVSQKVPEHSLKQRNSTEYLRLIQKHKAVLKRRSESMLYYNTRHGEKVPFCEHYVNLLIVNGHHSLENKKHEVLAFGQHRISLQQNSVEQRLIQPEQLFSHATGTQSAQKILVAGVAGIGKTVLVQKILFDFSNDKEHLAFDFIIHLTFRDLNLISKPVSFRELVLRKNGHLSKHLDTILENDSKLLILLDGFDEFKHYMGCDVDLFVTDPDEKGEVVEVLSSLMQGELLPGASVLLTSRPMAVSHIPVGVIDCFVLIMGFSSNEIRDFFHRFFQDGELASKMFETVAGNDLMLTLCYIPAFCYIVCSILKDNDGLSTNSPKTMTDIYTQYLVALIKSHTQNRQESLKCKTTVKGHLDQLREIVLKLGKLAYQKLMDHEMLFYSTDAEVAMLDKCGIVSTFLDMTSIQEPSCTEDVYSFTHLTVQEFLAALYCAMSKTALPENLRYSVERGPENMSGRLDLFARFLSGLLSERNQSLLSRNLGFKQEEDKQQTYRLGLLSSIQALCENGAYILTHLHCVFEQQDASLMHELQLQTLRINVSDVTLSTMDYTAIKYFLNEIQGTILELDLTGSNINAESLRDLQPYLCRCEKLWLGENKLDMKAVEVIADVLRSSDTIVYLGLGWTNIGDEEIFVLINAIKTRQTLSELWMEGNKVSYKGLSALQELTPFPLRTVAAIWNDVTDEEAEELNSISSEQCFTVSFTDDNRMWEVWAAWVYQRCEVSGSEKLVTFLQKVCNISKRILEIPWAETFYQKLVKLIKIRTDQCNEDDIRRKLEKFQALLSAE
ncbi:protein NLRC3-like [Chanos chanos]|uniref:Protein NLRC3-like n=1 Tax=Chanos chanos TaxID=29144 RepID=A0A6J2VQ17_CHACN|nr:protein NLRC3-like [Chanos chanos]